MPSAVTCKLTLCISSRPGFLRNGCVAVATHNFGLFSGWPLSNCKAGINNCSQVTAAEGYEFAWYATSQNGGLSRGTFGPGPINNYGDFWDANIIDLTNDQGEIGQFYSIVRLYENTDDPDTERNVILVNPYGVTVTDSTFVLSTSNQNLG